MNETATAAARRARISGGIAVALIVLSALGYSCHTIFARATYDYGPGPTSILFLRSAAATVAIFVLLKLRGVDPWLRGRAFWGGVVLGVLLSIQAMAMLSALYFIPVSLLILVFYMFPMIVAAVTHLAGTHRITAVGLGALVAAFAGVGIALGVSPEAPDWRGVGLGLVAALGVSLNIIGSAIVMKRADSIVVTFNMSVTMLVVFGVAALVRGSLALPASAAGWLPLSGTVLAYVVASLCFYTSVRRVGPSRVSMAMNMEPIFTISLAGLILAERLTLPQFAGAALVVAAIFTSTYSDLRSARRAEAATSD